MLNKLYLPALHAALALLFALSGTAAHAAEALRLQAVSKNVYAIVGPLGNRTAENLGNNATFGFVVTREGVVLIDAGGSFKGAAAIAALIRSVTDQPVKVVINTGGQDHRWLGNGYFQARGARIIASKQAVEDQQARVQDQLFMLNNLVGAQGMEGTEPLYSAQPFDGSSRFSLGGVEFELKHAGPAHTPGDSIVWLPQERIAFSGDIVYVERLLGVLEYSNSHHWLQAFDALAALQPKVVIPGHGAATNMTRAKADTYDYLLSLRQAVKDFRQNGGGIEAIGSIDQSRFNRLEGYDQLKGRNAQQVFQELEWE